MYFTPGERIEINRACRLRIKEAKARLNDPLSQPRPAHWEGVIKRCESVIQKIGVTSA